MSDTIGIGISCIASISSIEESRVSISITLTIVSNTIAIGSIGSISVSIGGIGIPGISSVKKSRISISITLTIVS